MLIPVETVLTFFMAAVILALAPGPDNIFVLTQSALYGKASGLWVTLGLCTVLIFGSVAMLAGTLGEWLNKSSKAQLVLNRVAGTVFIALALKLITTQR